MGLRDTPFLNLGPYDRAESVLAAMASPRVWNCDSGPSCGVLLCETGRKDISWAIVAWWGRFAEVHQ